MLLIHSHKTRRIGKSERLVPIMRSLNLFLADAFDQAEGERVTHFPDAKAAHESGHDGQGVCCQTKVESWRNFWNAIRSSAETDVMDSQGRRRACQWPRNSPATAMENYTLVRKSDFADSGLSLGRNADNRCVAERAGIIEQL